MSLLPGWETDLHEYSIQAVRIVPGDYGRPGTVEPITDPIPVSGQKQPSKEKIAAGVEAATIYLKLYSGPDLDSRIAEKTTLRVSDSSGELGRFNVRSRRGFRGEHVELEADALNTQ